MGIGNNKGTTPLPTPTKQTEPKVETENMYLTGLVYRNNNEIMLLAQDSGPVVLSDKNRYFDDLIDYAIIQVGVTAIAESYPGQTAAESVRVLDKVMTKEDAEKYEQMLTDMIDMGHTPADDVLDSIWTDINAALGAQEEPEPVVEDKEYKAFNLTNTDEKTYWYNRSVLMDNLVKKNGDNTIFSPMSLDLALGLTYNGAAGETLETLQQYLAMSQDDYNEWAKEYIGQNNETAEYKDNDNSENPFSYMELANSLWINSADGVELLEDYQKKVSGIFDASVESLPFDTAMVEKANNWVKEKTHNEIESILTEAPVDSPVVLMNALYFNGKWVEPFENYQVKDCDFTNADGSVSTITGMYETDDYYYCKENNTEFFLKRYTGGGSFGKNYVFVGILPENINEFSFADFDMNAILNIGNDSSVTKMSRQKLNIMIPKFDIDCQTNGINNLMTEMGLDLNNYPNIANAPLCVSDIIQKTTVNMMESGTIAAAVTAIVMETSAAVGVEPDPIDVYLNKPFAFMIVDMDANIPLFMGQVNNLPSIE